MVQYCLGRNIWLSDNPVEVFEGNIFPCWLDVMYQPRSSGCVTRINLGLMIDSGCRHAFGLKQEAHLLWIRDSSRVNWDQFFRYQVRANETYSEAKRQFNDRNRDVLMNIQSPHKWWSTLKSAVFGSSSSSPPLVREGGGLVCEVVGKADLLSDHFDIKQSREAVDLPLTCNPSPSLTTFAFRSSEVRRLYMDPYGGTDPLGMFPLFLKRTADVMAPPFQCSVSAACSSRQVPSLLEEANVTPIQKGPLSPSVANY